MNEINDELQLAAMALVKGKYNLDFKLEKLKSAHFLIRWYSTLFGIVSPQRNYPATKIAIAPATFVWYALPFSYHCYDGSSPEPPELISVNSCYVVGSTYKYYFNESNDIESIVNFLDKETAKSQFSICAAYYFRVGKLPLYIANEGKNRVLIYQQAYRQIMAWVMQFNFPAPKDLFFHRIAPFGLFAISCRQRITTLHKSNEVLNGGLYILPFHQLVLPLLKAYGVKEGRPVYSIKVLLSWLTIRKRITKNLCVE